MKRILIVDDNEEFVLAFLFFLKKKFGQNGFSETYAQSAIEALKVLEHSGFDLIISDLEMSDGDGLFLLDSLGHLQKDIPFIFLTATPELVAGYENKNLKAVIGKSDFEKIISCLEKYMIF